MKFRTEGLIIKEQNIGEQDKLVFALTKLFNTGVDHFKCNYKCTQNSEQRPFCGRKIVKATENENIKCRNKVKSHMTFAFYGKAETSECTFKTFDLLFHTP